MERIDEIMEELMDAICERMDNLESIDTDEAGKVIDMIKDLAEVKEKEARAAYYNRVVKAMDHTEPEMKKRSLEEYVEMDNRIL